MYLIRYKDSIAEEVYQWIYYYFVEKNNITLRRIILDNSMGIRSILSIKTLKLNEQKKEF